MADDQLPLTAHLEELRTRIIRSLVAIGIGFFIAYFFSQDLFLLLSQPLTEQLPEQNSFIFTNVTEAFFTYLKLAFFAGLFVSFPVIVYQIWCFVAPGLYQHEKRYVVPFILLSTIFFVSGSAFCYFFVFPIAFKFFLGFNTHDIRMLPSIKEYLSFSCKLLLAFGIVFEMPIFILFLSKIGVVNHKQLRAQRKIVIVIVFVVAAILTPPDIVSQILMAIPLIILFEISIVVAKLFGKKPAAADEDNDQEEDSGQ